jgi:glycosyltransferase involved in cell wall biosynthesis
VLEKVCESATAVVVMTETARRLLAAHYDNDHRKVSVIPHGVADWMAVAPTEGPRVRTILTWGLLGPGKGIEWGIRAMKELAAIDSELHYLVAGQTHPKVLAHEGEQYRESLQALIDELGLGDRVTLDGRYLQPIQLAGLVASAEVVLLPYDTRDQVTSGVLAEAVAAGKQVVATGFPHSLELLRRGTGTIVAHEDPVAIAEAIRRILNRRPRAAAVAPRTIDPTTSWPAVAEQYRRLVGEIQVARTA